jgi:RND family efflux transporter MFP subunit
MTFRRILGSAVAVVVISSLVGGVYLRSRGDDEDNGGTVLAEVPEGGAEAVSSASTFSTDVAIPVEGAMVVRDTLVISVSAAAEAAASRQAVLRAQVEGRITSLRVEENDAAGSGRLLIQIDTTEYGIAVDRARARLATATATYDELTMFDDEIEDERVRTERARFARAKSGLADAELGVREAELQLQRTRIRAPFAGRVASLRVVEGQQVRLGDELLTVVDLDPIRVEVQVLESEVGLLAEGRGATIAFAAFPGESFSGRIATINPVVERETRTARTTVTISNPQGRILPGMYARVSLEARKFPDRVMVPRAAILERDRRTMLFVFEGENDIGFAKWRYVTPGMMNDSLVEIVANPQTDMVEAGEWVLIDGHYTLIHDARVRLVESVRAEGGRPQ